MGDRTRALHGQQTDGRDRNDFGFYVGVTLSRGELGMAQDLLELPSISDLLGEESAIGVTEGVDPEVTSCGIPQGNPRPSQGGLELPTWVMLLGEDKWEVFRRPFDLPAEKRQQILWNRDGGPELGSFTRTAFGLANPDEPILEIDFSLEKRRVRGTGTGCEFGKPSTRAKQRRV